MKQFKKVIFSCILGLLLGWTFYKSILMSIFFIIFLLIYLIRFKKSDNRNLTELCFKTFLNSIYIEILVGHSFRNAVKNSQESNRFEQVHFAEAVNTLMVNISLGISELAAWQEFADVINIPTCDSFVRVLKATYLEGGQLTEVLKYSIKVLSDQVDLTLELSVMISAKKFEFYLMMILPIMMIAFLSYSNQDYMFFLFNGLVGHMIMTAILFLMIIAYVLGEKIMEFDI